MSNKVICVDCKLEKDKNECSHPIKFYRFSHGAGEDPFIYDEGKYICRECEKKR